MLLSLGSSVLEVSQDTARKKDKTERPSSESKTARTHYEVAKIPSSIPEKPKVDLSLIEQAVSTLPSLRDVDRGRGSLLGNL